MDISMYVCMLTYGYNTSSRVNAVYVCMLTYQYSLNGSPRIQWGHQNCHTCMTGTLFRHTMNIHYTSSHVNVWIYLCMYVCWRMKIRWMGPRAFNEYIGIATHAWLEHCLRHTMATKHRKKPHSAKEYMVTSIKIKEKPSTNTVTWRS